MTCKPLFLAAAAGLTLAACAQTPDRHAVYTYGPGRHVQTIHIDGNRTIVLRDGQRFYAAPRAPTPPRPPLPPHAFRFHDGGFAAVSPMNKEEIDRIMREARAHAEAARKEAEAARREGRAARELGRQAYAFRFDGKEGPRTFYFDGKDFPHASPMSREEIDRIVRDARTRADAARAQGEAARRQGEAARQQGEEARRQGQEARRRAEAMRPSIDEIRRNAERLKEQCERGEIRCEIIIAK
jgi:hypothetical protein